MKKKSSKISQPNHYNWITGIPCEMVAQHFDFSKGNVIKYIWRSGKKNSESELDDLLKAHHYLVLAIKTVTGDGCRASDIDDLIESRKYLDEAIELCKIKNKGTK